MNHPSRPRLKFFDMPPGQQHISPGDRYLYTREEPRHRVAVIGTGTIGMEHMRVATRLGRVAIHGVYDEQRESVDVALEAYTAMVAGALRPHGTPRRYASIRAACEDPEVDALLICTPNHTHRAVLEEVAVFGKPILLEKPMATTLADAGRICDIAATYDGFIQVGLQYRYKAAYVEARHEALQRGTIGRLHTLSMSEYRPPFLDKVGQWNKFTEFSGGTLVEKCCHYFDLLTLFARARPARVYASAGCAVNFRDFEYRGRRADIDDHAFVIIEYANGVRASFTLNMFSPRFYEELVISGEGGRLIATEHFDFQHSDTAEARLTIERHEDGASRSVDAAYARHIEQSGHHGATWFEHIAFADRLDGRANDAATPIEGLWSVVIATAAQTSAASGQAVNIETLIEAHGLTHLLGQETE